LNGNRATIQEVMWNSWTFLLISGNPRSVLKVWKSSFTTRRFIDACSSLSKGCFGDIQGIRATGSLPVLSLLCSYPITESNWHALYAAHHTSYVSAPSDSRLIFVCWVISCETSDTVNLLRCRLQTEILRGFLQGASEIWAYLYVHVLYFLRLGYILP